ncbi:SGNH/GDSL hydrolase family protein [Emticicia fluvialis]|uniref:SGNH/GDSL hydrolase family protein n=1 Tax=Emticicia fluvialis TaxID=2974474 RepID=UPI0021653D97|nr:SGNH/GDSL hydrolase family protein [Emticicia fluvialis]
MYKFFAHLSLATFLFSCVSGSPSTVELSPQKEENIPERSFLALGDSYTIGESVLEKDRWANQLIELLKSDFTINRFDVVAGTGWTTRNLADAVARTKPAGTYDMVSLMIGVNNQFNGQSIDTYKKEFTELLETSATLAHADARRVFVLSIPDYSITPYAQAYNKEKIAQDIDAFNKVAKDACDKMGISFIDITTLTREHPEAAYIADDQLHFSAKMHDLWASRVVGTVKIILR